MTPFETTLIAAIGTAIVGIGSFITWFVKQVLPKIFESWDKLISRLDSFGNKMDKFGERMDKFGQTAVQLENSLKNNTIAIQKNELETYRLREDLFDKRFQSLEERITNNSSALIEKNNHPESRHSITGEVNN